MFLHDRIDPNDRFRERRRQSRRRRRTRRMIALLALAGIAAAIAGGATYFSSHGHTSSKAPATVAKVHPLKTTSPFRGHLPTEIRGIHITEGLASIPNRFEDYLQLTSHGLNTIELDVKDENGY